MRVSALCDVAFLAAAIPGFAEGPTFDVASVKLAAPDVRPPFTMTGGPGTNDPSRFSAPRVGMVELLRRAFDVEEDQISGPSWLRDLPPARPFYSVVATMPPDTTKEQFQKMLQNLLIGRFHLVFHDQTRNFNGYQLVVDKTGLTGKYTFVLAYYTAAVASLRAGRASAASDAANASPAPSEPGGGGLDIFTAIQKQLGLRLDKVPDVPADVIVVDSVDKVPTED